jgi:hypothetical protein
MTGSLFDPAEMKAEFLKLTLQVVLGDIEVGIDAAGKLVRQVEETGMEGKAVGVGVHAVIPFD